MYKSNRRDVDLRKVRKQGSKVIFEFEDDKNFIYDLATKEFFGLSGRKVQRPSSQFNSIKLRNFDMKNKFEDKGFYDFLVKVSEATSRRNLASVLDAAADSDFNILESYARVGINVDDDITVKLENVPKLARNWFAANKYRKLNDKIVEAWKYNAALLESILSHSDDSTKNICNMFVWNIINEHKRWFYNEEDRNRYDPYWMYKGRELIQTDGYEPSALINYLSSICYYEGLEINSALDTLYDYVRMQKNMQAKTYDKYPRCLLTTHHIAVRNYNRIRAFHDEVAFSRTYDERFNWTYQGMKFICPKKSSDITDEAIQQQHCVASYIDDVIAGRTRILFMRNNDDPDKSLITLEYRNGRITHARGYLNRMPTETEQRLINRYEEHLTDALSEDSSEHTASA